MVEPMTTGVIELFPFRCKSPKNEPYRNRYLLGNGGTNDCRCYWVISLYL
jgi:hypothetical protein